VQVIFEFLDIPISQVLHPLLGCLHNLLKLRTVLAFRYLTNRSTITLKHWTFIKPTLARTAAISLFSLLKAVLYKICGLAEGAFLSIHLRLMRMLNQNLSHRNLSQQLAETENGFSHWNSSLQI
jgi:hypothetical protein